MDIKRKESAMTNHICNPSVSADDTSTLPLLLTVKQAADLLNVSPHHVRNLCANGKIRSVKVGSKWRIGRDAFLEQFEINGRRNLDAPSNVVAAGETVEIVIRIEMPAELAKQLVNAKVMVDGK